MARVTNENYLNYLSFHGRTVDAAWYVVKKWGPSSEYHTHDTIRQWVDASAYVLHNSGEK